MYRTARLLSLLLMLSSIAGCDDPRPVGPGWPGLRGPHGDGSHPAAGRTADAPLQLRTAWTRELGPGYSGVSVGEGTAVTMYAGDVEGFVVAFSAEDGRELWRHSTGPRRVGHSGAADGPLGTPAIHAGLVIALSSSGELLALELASGEERWSIDLPERHGALAMPHGFASSPLPVDDLVIVQTGSPEGSTMAFDLGSGELRWAHGDDPVGYQSPILVVLAGQIQVLVATTHHIFGLDRKSGVELWRHEHLAPVRDGHTQIVPVENDRLLVHYINGALLYRFGEVTDGSPLVELWRSLAFKSTLCPPIYHAGHLYGFRGEKPVALHAETGEVVWTAEDAAGHGLILVGNRLSILGTEGELILAPAAPGGFEASLRVSTGVGDSYTWPSYADGRIFLRNHDRLTVMALFSRGDGSRLH